MQIHILKYHLECEHCGVKGHDIDHRYSLHPEFCFNKSINNKDGKSKRGHKGGYSSQSKGKITSKVPSKVNDQG